MVACLVTNIPAPYRLPVYDLLPKAEFSVIFCARREKNRQWQLPELSFQHEFLSERVTAASDGFNYRHNNPDVWSVLNRLRPRVVITTGFNPTHLYAFAWAKLRGASHISMTDGTTASEAGLSRKHRLLRRFVFSGTDAYIAASSGGRALYGSYGVDDESVFQSHLCADNMHFAAHASNTNRPYDVMFSGRFHEGKLPFFFVDVCQSIKHRRGECKALLIGDGPLKDQVLMQLSQAGIDFEYPGFVQQGDLPYWYSRAKVFLFPTRLDSWGVVANEAMAAGTPVITSSTAGVAGALVIDGVTGFVLPPQADEWANLACQLIDQPDLWSAYSLAGQLNVAEYNYQAAADGILKACQYTLEKKRKTHAFFLTISRVLRFDYRGNSVGSILAKYFCRLGGDSLRMTSRLCLSRDCGSPRWIVYLFPCT